MFWPKNCYSLNKPARPKLDFMKNRLPLISLLCLFYALFIVACSKSSNSNPVVAPTSSFTFSAGDSLISYPVNLVYLQDVTNRHTTLISGQYPDTSSKKGSLSFRLIGDTTGRYRSDSLLVTYTDAKGKTYYNTGDSTNYVQVDKFPKTYNGVVNGNFSVSVSNSSGSIQFSKGSFVAIFQK
jgi:hypothetical protein